MRRRRSPDCCALPIAGYTTYYMMKDLPFAFERRRRRSARPPTSDRATNKQVDPDRERTEDRTVTKPVAVEP